jgi:site-specific recombinase XerD
VLRGQGDEREAERFMKASTHWRRHLHASHAVAAGMSIEIAQQNLGHAPLAATTVCVTTLIHSRLFRSSKSCVVATPICFRRRMA